MNTSNQINNNKHRIDRYVKKQIDILDFSPILLKSWSKSKSWEVIKGRISKVDSKVISWSLALAATVSLTVAAGLQFNIDSIFQRTPEIAKEVASLPNMTGIAPESDISEKEIIDVKEVYSKTITNEPVQNNRLITPFNSSSYSKTSFNNQHLFDNSIVKQVIHPFLSFRYNSQGVAPEIGIDFLIYSIQNDFKSKHIKLGVSTEFIQQKDEILSNISPAHFVSMTYEIIDTKTNKGWSIKSGILLNPDSNYYQHTTVKLGLKRQFNKWIKFGPDLIFTNNLKTIYPSLTLSVG